MTVAVGPSATRALAILDFADGRGSMAGRTAPSTLLVRSTGPGTKVRGNESRRMKVEALAQSLNEDNRSPQVPEYLIWMPPGGAQIECPAGFDIVQAGK